ncbi:MAG TPA: serine hydrolase domain-containing protein [Terriglobia bacterium]|nr:serine hydrolase domain-containing protein [Terriglobia bacterium]
MVDGHEIVWAQGFGYADPKKKTPATAETVYRVGSVSKLFTAIGVMQLVERGQLNLDAPIEKVLPDFHPPNPFGTPITLRDLMSHRSGLVREPPDGSSFDARPPLLADVVRSLNSTDLVYAPGTRTKYSNAGATVADFALEQKTGEPFAEYVERHVLRPMGLQMSGFEPAPQLAGGRAKGFMWTYDGRVFPAPTFSPGPVPAEGLDSTVADLGRFITVLLDGGRGPGGQVLKPETLRDMETPRLDQHSVLTPFGIGFALGSLDGHRVVGHDGAIYGFATSLEALPDDRLGAVAVTTMDSANAVTDRIVHEALASNAGRPRAPTFAGTLPLEARGAGSGSPHGRPLRPFGREHHGSRGAPGQAHDASGPSRLSNRTAPTWQPSDRRRPARLRRGIPAPRRRDPNRALPVGAPRHTQTRSRAGPVGGAYRRIWLGLRYALHFGEGWKAHCAYRVVRVRPAY